MHEVAQAIMGQEGAVELGIAEHRILVDLLHQGQGTARQPPGPLHQRIAPAIRAALILHPQMRGAFGHAGAAIRRLGGQHGVHGVETASDLVDEIEPAACALGRVVDQVGELAELRNQAHRFASSRLRRGR